MVDNEIHKYQFNIHNYYILTTYNYMQRPPFKGYIGFWLDERCGLASFKANDSSEIL